MASLIRKPNGNWQARIRKHKQTKTKTFINKADDERWARQVEVEYLEVSFKSWEWGSAYMT